ncbi:MAG: calcium/sodium antiporter [Acutalibacteraceae bacterium]
MLGLVLIIKGGDLFVDAASWIAEVSGIPKFIIGATIVSLATTLPELLVSVFAAVDNKTDIAIGNAVGSVTANTGLIMAISIIAMPAIIKRQSFAPKGIMLLAAVGALCGFTFVNRELNLFGSICLFIFFIYFMYDNVKYAKENIIEEKTKIKNKQEVVTNILKFIGGTVGIVVGADLLVDNGSALATIMHVPESIIGVTIIAIGTSLPELVTTITAISKKQSSLSIGNIIGANIIDTTLILPICSFITRAPVPVSQQSIALDLPACLIISSVAVIPTLIFSKFSRWQGILMMILYISYLVILIA